MPPQCLSTITASHVGALGGNPVSDFALTTASLLPWRATVVGTWNRSLVISPVMVAFDRSVRRSPARYFIHRRADVGRLMAEAGYAEIHDGGSRVWRVALYRHG